MSPSNPYSRLAPFIQSYIYQNNWSDLREIQKAAIPAILDSSDHVLIMSGTASGKTEAAMLPTLTILDQSPVESVGILYIGPLKALINDQFDRVQALLQDKPEIPIQGWHGDIADHQKRRFMRRPRGILQITPESMEAMFVNRADELGLIFRDLRFIIIDEIHAFIGTDRGQQVLCHLQRLERAILRPIRRIGLTATIGDTDIALRWLESSSLYQTPARLVTESTRGRRIELRLNHFVLGQENKTVEAPMAPLDLNQERLNEAILPSPLPTEESEPGYPLDLRWELQQARADYYDDLFAMTMRHPKTLIFTNRRNRAEQIAAELRHRLEEVQPGKDWYFVHHSSIASDLRDNAEERMRDKTQPACTIATATLELGIDIGQLDLTIQVEAPHTVSSFVQRLGRSGRRGTPSRMCFYTLEYLNPDTTTPPELDQIPWNFLQTIAIIQLYLEEQWIEPPILPTLPLSLLYQQTMSILKSQTEMGPAQLAQAVLKLSPFQSVTLDEYRLFLQQLVSLDHITQMEEGTLIVGLKGEQITKKYTFYAIFPDSTDCQVFAGSQEIGTVQGLPTIDTTIGLAGYAWRVISVDERARTIHVERARGKTEPNWISNAGGIYAHEHVMQRLRRILQEETVYAYLSPLGQQRLALLRDVASQSTWVNRNIVRLEPGCFALFPWTSSRIFTTLVHILRATGWYKEGGNKAPYYQEIVYDGDAGAVIQALRELSPRVPEIIQTRIKDLKDNQLAQNKHDPLAPRPLLEKAYLNDVLDIPGTVEWLANCI